MKTKLAMILSACALASCASSPPIQRVSESKSHFSTPIPLMSHNYPEKDIYRVYEQAATGFVPVSSVRSYAEERAEKFCERQGKGMVVLGSRTWPPFPIPTQFPQAEVIFAAVPKP